MQRTISNKAIAVKIDEGEQLDEFLQVDVIALVLILRQWYSIC